MKEKSFKFNRDEKLIFDFFKDEASFCNLSQINFFLSIKQNICFNTSRRWKKALFSLQRKGFVKQIKIKGRYFWVQQ